MTVTPPRLLFPRDIIGQVSRESGRNLWGNSGRKRAAGLGADIFEDSAPFVKRNAKIFINCNPYH
jgi:hypothetical protein